MQNRDAAPGGETPLSHDLLQFLRWHLGGRRVWVAVAAIAGAGGLIFNWSWLVAIGVAPVLFAILPCAAMCALGLCVNRMTGAACSSEQPGAQPEADARLRDEHAIPPLQAVKAADERWAHVEDAEVTEDDAGFAQARTDDPTVSDGLTATTTERS